MLRVSQVNPAGREKGSCLSLSSGTSGTMASFVVTSSSSLGTGWVLQNSKLFLAASSVVLADAEAVFLKKMQVHAVGERRVEGRSLTSGGLRGLFELQQVHGLPDLEELLAVQLGDAGGVVGRGPFGDRRRRPWRGPRGGGPILSPIALLGLVPDPLLLPRESRQMVIAQDGNGGDSGSRLPLPLGVVSGHGGDGGRVVLLLPVGVPLGQVISRIRPTYSFRRDT